jgi:hypothetical protein
MFAHAARFRDLSLVFVAFTILLLLPTRAAAWADHWAITRSAMAVLPPDSSLKKLLGDEIGPMIGTYSVNPDFLDRLMWVQSPLDWWYYTNDYLLYPAVNRQIRHEVPAVLATHRPFFRRALQALRTENAFNAARWLGSLLHFLQDTGAPPHAYHYPDQRPGDHALMECLMNPDKTWVPEYKPVLLGHTEADAEDGLDRRMKALIEYSASRAVGMVPLAHANNEAALGPIEDEVARECARVCADVLLTLGELAKVNDTQAGTLEGTVVSDPAPGMEGVTAKVILDGTNYSTLANWNGYFSFRNLPAGSYSVTAFRSGSEPASWRVTIQPGAVTKKRFEMLSLDPANLLRNPSFSVRWSDRALPDGWTAIPGGWQSEWLAVYPGKIYRLSAARLDPSTTPIVLWFPDQGVGPNGSFELPAESGRAVCTAPGNTHWARVYLRTQVEPQKAVRRVSLALDSAILGRPSMPQKGAKLFSENLASPNLSGWRAFGADGKVTDTAPAEITFEPIHDKGYVTTASFESPFVMELRVKITSPNDFEFGPILWFEKGGIRNQHVKLRATNCQLWTHDERGYRDLSAPADLHLTGGEWHQVTILQTHDKEEVWVDGVFVWGYRGKDLPVSSGRVGLGGHGFEVRDLTVFAAPDSG